MDKQETTQILSIVKVAYPMAFNKLTTSDANAMINLWELQFKEFKYEDVYVAINIFISNNTSQFPPTIAQLKEIIIKANQPEMMTEIEAWEKVGRVISRGVQKEDYDKLPETIKRIATMATMKEWGKVNLNEYNTVIASNFQRSYKARSKYENEQAMIPLEIKQLVETKLLNKRNEGDDK